MATTHNSPDPWQFSGKDHLHFLQIMYKSAVSEHTLLPSPQATQKHASLVQNKMCFDRHDFLLTLKAEHLLLTVL